MQHWIAFCFLCVCRILEIRRVKERNQQRTQNNGNIIVDSVRCRTIVFVLCSGSLCCTKKKFQSLSPVPCSPVACTQFFGPSSFSTVSWSRLPAPTVSWSQLSVPQFPVPSSLSPLCCPQFPRPSSLSQFPAPSSLSQVPCPQFPLRRSLSPVPQFPVPSSLSPLCCPQFPAPSSLSQVPCPQFPAPSSCLQLPGSHSPPPSALPSPQFLLPGDLRGGLRGAQAPFEGGLEKGA